MTMNYVRRAKGSGHRAQKKNDGVKGRMGELNINIIRTPEKSVVRKVLGIINILLEVIWLGFIIFTNEKVPIASIIMSIYILIFGLIYFIDGSGISISEWFGEAFIRIDERRICIKKGVFSKEWGLFWDQVDRVTFSVIRIMFSLKDGTKKELNYDNLEYEHIQEIKNIIMVITSEKNIAV
jgi:hypothetical protein